MELLDKPPGIYIDVYRGRKYLGQVWRWRAVSASNGKQLAHGGEAYLREADCLDAVFRLFSDESTIYLRHCDNGVTVLREAA